LGMCDGGAYCHRRPTDRRSRVFIGHPFTADNKDLWLSVVQTNAAELTLQIHNPTDAPITTTVRRTPYFDLLPTPPIHTAVPAGATVEYVLTGKGAKRSG